MKVNERLQALQILQKVIEDKLSLAHLSGDEQASPYVKALCFGVCRHFFRLQAIVDSLVKKRPDISVHLALIMGLYQLIYQNKPEYAVVKETVDLMHDIKKDWAKSILNAVLRRFCREKEAILQALSTDKMFLYGHPGWFIKQLQKDWPNDWQTILQANDNHPPMTLRVNEREVTRDAYLSILQDMGLVAAKTVYAPQAITLEQPCDVNSLPHFNKGFVSIQDEAAQLAISLLDLQPGQRVLDACCAPGGKTCHILESEPQLSECVAVDIDEKRLQRVKENLQRLKLSATLLCGDAAKPEPWWDGKRFERILLDVPCSATGVIRRHPDIKLLRTREEITAVCSLQQTILQSIWPLLQENGVLVYVTCSVLKAENDDQIAAFIAHQTDCEVLPIEADWGIASTYGRQILPGQANTDGFFYAILRKRTLHA